MFKKVFKKFKEKKGFTLAELLIVVAIIAVLVAIAVPIFTSQLEKSREATDKANIRSAMSTLQAAYLNGEEDVSDANSDSTIPYAYKDGSYIATVTPTQKKAGWQSADDKSDKVNIGGKSVEAKVSDAWTVTINSDGALSVA